MWSYSGEAYSTEMGEKQCKMIIGIREDTYFKTIWFKRSRISGISEFAEVANLCWKQNISGESDGWI